jgi:hypothetical protein
LRYLGDDVLECDALDDGLVRAAVVVVEDVIHAIEDRLKGLLNLRPRNLGPML